MTGETKAVLSILIVTVVIIIAGLTLTQKKAASPTIQITPEILVSSSTPIQHKETAQISIVGFEDFACPACAMLHPKLKETLAAYNGKVSFALRLLPIHGPESIKSAVAAYAAGEQGKFFEIADLLFSNQTAWSGKDEVESKKIFTEYATVLQLDVEAFTSKINSPEFKASVEKIVTQDNIDATKMGIRSTPTLIINGKTLIVGVQTVETLKRIIDAELQAIETASGSATSTVDSASTGNTTANSTGTN